MKNSYKKMLATSTLCFFMQTVVAEQKITADIVEQGDTLSIVPTYSVTSPQGGHEIGLGLRLHFDSSKVEFSSIDELYSGSSLGASAVQNDIDDSDQDTKTDKVIVASWVDVGGQWPGVDSLPFKLFTAKFDKKSNYSGLTTFRFSSSSHVVGSTFRADPVAYSDCLKPEVSLSTAQTILDRAGQKSTQIIFSIAEPLPAGCGDLDIVYEILGDTLLISSLKILSGGVQAELILDIRDFPAAELDEILTVTISNLDTYTVNPLTPSLSITLRAGKETPEDSNTLDIPTLTEWMMILMSLGLWGVVILNNYRKGKQ